MVGRITAGGRVRPIIWTTRSFRIARAARHCPFTARIIRSARLSSRWLCTTKSAQIEATGQPMSVIIKMTQMIA